MMTRHARFFPDLVHEERRADPRFRAEVRFYDLLGQQLPAGWTVFYNVAWLGRRWEVDRLRDGETDFILAHPDRGVLVLELKGGLITFDGSRQQWLSTDAQGVQHEITNPFYQARSGKYNLRDRLEDFLGYPRADIRLCHAVVFTGVDRPADPITEEARPEIVIGRQDLGRLRDRVCEVLAHSLGRESFLHGREIVDGLVRLLGRTVTLPNPLRSQIEDEHVEIQTLTNSQIDLFRRLQGTRRLAIGGGAGSGKTYVAVRRARDLARQGFRTLLVCHAAPLARYLRELTAGQEGLDVLTAAELTCRFVPGLDPRAADADETFPGHLLDALAALPAPPYQSVLVDEGQDFSADWFVALQACVDGGPRGVFYVFHDTNNQTVRPGRGKLPDDLLAFDLSENVRNTQRICRAMQPYYRGDVAIAPRGPDGRAVAKYPYAAAGELGQRLGGVLSQLLLVENLLARDIVVLTPRDPLATSGLPDARLPNGMRLVTDPAQVRARNVLLSSITDFKGLERPVVVVAELDDQLPADPGQRAALLYVAFSRPRNLLCLLGTPAVLAGLD